MPTTRRRRGRGRAGLSGAAMTAFLIGEWPTSADGTRPLGRLGWFLLTDDERRSLWLENRGTLMAEWRRLGAAGQPWGAKFDVVESQEKNHA